MDGTVNNDDVSHEKLMEQINALQDKYNQLNNEVDILKSSKSDLTGSMKAMNESLQQVNKNIEQIMSQFNKPEGDMGMPSMGNIMNARMGRNVKKLLSNPIRRVAVETICTTLTILDKGIEVVSCVKEGLEDIVAEATYQKQRRHMPSAEKG